MNVKTLVAERKARFIAWWNAPVNIPWYVVNYVIMVAVMLEMGVALLLLAILVAKVAH
jgi:hypothetical protein